MIRVPGFRRLFRLDRADDVERSVDDELQFHFDMTVRELTAAGWTVSEARAEARRRFGSLEATRDRLASLDRVRVGAERRTEWWSALAQDLRYAARGLRLKPGFTMAVMLTLGLGIGANATMFGIVDRLLFRPPAFLPDADRVHRVYFVQDFDGREFATASTSYKRYLDLRAMTGSFTDLADVFTPRLAVGTGDDARELNLQAVSASYWRLFDAPPVIGRYFGPDEDRPPSGARVVVLGYAFWRSQFGGRASVIGRPLRVGRNEYTIIGVAPKGFAGAAMELPSLFIPITAGIDEIAEGDHSRVSTYGWRWPNIVVRRRAGVSVAQANADLTQAFHASYALQRVEQPSSPPESLTHPRALAAPVQSERGPRQSGSAKVALWLIGVSVIVLIIACANVGNLLLARAFGRRREIAVRLALGISRARLTAQLFTESLLLALLGAFAGVAIAQWGGSVLRATLLPGVSWTSALSDQRLLLFTLSAAVAAGLLAGLAPIVFARRSDLAGALKAGAREGTYHRSRLRTALLVVQGALSVVLLVGAGLFVRSFHNAQALQLGFDPDQVLRVEVEMRGVERTKEQAADLRQQLVERAEAVPGVERAARGLTAPFSSTWSFGVRVAGLDTSFTNRFEFALQSATPGYLETMGTRLLRGRSIEATDRAGGANVVVISESMARLLWPGRDAIGECLQVGADTSPCRTVVGIAENIRLAMADDSSFNYYMPSAQFHPETGGIMVRVRGDAEAMVPAVRRALQSVMPAPAYVTVSPLRDAIAPEQRQWKLGATMFTVFGLLALLVAAIGLYSVVAYGVAQRTHELGVRVALGAQARDVVRLVVGGGLRVTALAVVLGLVAAGIASRWIAPLLFRTTPRDPLVFGGVALVLLAIAVIACAIPARRALRVDPSLALRAD